MAESLTGNTIASTYKTLLKAGSNNPVALASGSSSSERLVFGEDDAADVRTAVYVTQDRIGLNASDPGTLLEVRGDAGTGAASAGVLTLSTAETSVRVGTVDQLGRIDFQAPKESGGTDAILVGASIWAECEEDFSSSNNSTGLVFATGTTAAAAEQMRIDQDGNVGIGTSSPAQTLDILAAKITSTDLSSQVLVRDTTAYNSSPMAGIGFRCKFNTAGSFTNMGGITVGKENATDGNYSGFMKFMTVANGGGVTEQMRIDSSGNVGIGVTDPVIKSGNAAPWLTVASNGPGIILRDANNADNSLYECNNSGARQWGIMDDDGGNAVEHMRIDSSGNVGIGTASPSELLNVYSIAAAGNEELATFEFVPAASGNTGSVGINLHYNGAGGSYKTKLFQNSGNGGFGYGTHVDTVLENSYTGAGEYGSIQQVTGGFVRMTVMGGTGSTAGYVGIGTSSPGSALDVQGGTAFVYAPTAPATVNIGLRSDDLRSTLDISGDAATGYRFEVNPTSNVLQLFERTGTNTYTEKIRADGDLFFHNDKVKFDSSGNVGIGTTAPGQILDVNSGGGNMIADGYDTHSLAVYKENIEDASGYLDKVLACPAQKWNRKPFVSANEIKEAVLEEFGEDVLIEEEVEAQDAVYETVVVQEAVEAVEEELWAEGDDLPEGVEVGDVKVEAVEAQEEETEEQLVSEAIESKDAVYEKQYSVWDELFPEDNSHRQKALYNMPDGDLKTWIDDWCEAKRVEMRPEDKWQKKRLGLVADAELTAEHLPEVVSINDDGEPTGIDTMTYIGILHNAIQELSAKVEALENA